MQKILLIDGNSIMNRAFYGIMGSKALTTEDGKYTNALYGFLAILFKNIEETKPDYIMVAFDSKTGANTRKKKYDNYKKSRHGMPEELAYQMPEIKEILDAMKINHIELAEYEGDDILGTIAKKFSNKDLQAHVLSGDRDLLQLVDDNIIVKIPKTKAGKTTTEIYDKNRVQEEYHLTPKQLIELKGLMGDSSDEIPGCPGVGPKTATNLLEQYETIQKLYSAIENNEDTTIREKLKNNLIENKDLVLLSKELGTIDTNAQIDCEIENIKYEDWKNEDVLKQFQKYRFNRFIERFELSDFGEPQVDEEKIQKEISVTNKKIEDIEITNQLIYYIDTEKSTDENKIIKNDILGIGIYEQTTNSIVYAENPTTDELKKIFEDKTIEKIGFDICNDYVLLRENGIKMQNIKYDIEVAVYDIDPTSAKHTIEECAMQYLGFDIKKYIPEKQINLFETNDDKNEIGAYIYAIKELYNKTQNKLVVNNSIKLFNEIEMPLITVLAEMQYNGIQCDKQDLIKFGEELKAELETLTQKIYEYAGEEFNINSTQQLGKILFEKLKLPPSKKNKKGYATDVTTLEGLKDKHPIIDEILKYRSIMKLNSTYVEGLIPCINPSTGRIHAHFNQTIATTGRISCTDPNLQNIPTRDEYGKNIKKAFKAPEGYVFIDADYSQIELRVLAHISHDENMINAFKNDEDIHKQVASKVFNTPMEEVTHEQRSRAKAVNFGIVYGITAFGLAKQINITRKAAGEYIENYLNKYKGVKEFMNTIVEKAEKDGYVETLFERRRYIPELKASNYMVREFGKRAAMNTPIQGTAADIMKIAMNKVYDELNKQGIDAKILLQVHDELILEVKKEEAQIAKQILKQCMENAVKLDVPLKVETSEAFTWYEAK